MADKTQFKTRDEERPDAPAGHVYSISRKLAVVADSAAQNDRIVIQNLPKGHVILRARLGHDATLGASCTAKLASGTTALTAATTAGAASYVMDTVACPIDAAADQSFNILIEGAAIAATAIIYVDAVVLNRGAAVA